MEALNIAILEPFGKPAANDSHVGKRRTAKIYRFAETQ